uniref:Uncharacterized protein n=1 Tax=Anguilla anguilla TaxID=7936 RepID=A0A0E9WF69_ANGAN
MRFWWKKSFTDLPEKPQAGEAGSREVSWLFLKWRPALL